jgi:hypothetical protein
MALGSRGPATRSASDGRGCGSGIAEPRRGVGVAAGVRQRGMLTEDKNTVGGLQGDGFIFRGGCHERQGERVLEWDHDGATPVATDDVAPARAMHRGPGVGTDGAGGGVVVDRRTKQRGCRFVPEVIEAGLVAGGDPGQMAARPGEHGSHHRGNLGRNGIPISRTSRPVRRVFGAVVILPSAGHRRTAKRSDPHHHRDPLHYRLSRRCGRRSV